MDAYIKNNVRHERAVFLHKGTSQQNTHYHFLAKPKTDASLFCRLARKQWAALSTHTMGYLDTQIETVQSNEAAANYMLHEYKSLGANTLFTPATHINAANIPVAKYRNIFQLRRLLKLESLELNRTFEGGDSAVDYIAA